MHLNKMFVDAIKEIESELKPETVTAIHRLLEYTGKFNRFTGHFGVTVFENKNNSVSFGILSKVMQEQLAVASNTPRSKSDAFKLLEEQFATHEQNVLYCGDTKNLLAILTEFCSTGGEETYIIAVPDAWCSCNYQAYIDHEELANHTDKKREVTVYIKDKEYFLAFTFKESIS